MCSPQTERPQAFLYAFDLLELDGRTCGASPSAKLSSATPAKMGLEGIVSKRHSPDWLMFKNPEAPAVRREAEEDWVRRHSRDWARNLRGKRALARRLGQTPMNRTGPKRGSGRSDLKRFPYEPRMVAGKVIMPADLQRLHLFMLENEVIATIPDDMRAVVERVWPELVPKLPRREREE